MKTIIADPAVNRVSGNIQYGKLTKNIFKIYGVLDMTDNSPQYFRGAFDINEKLMGEGSLPLSNFPFIEIR